MKQFKDALERTWSITVTVASIKAVRDVTGVDLSRIFSDQSKSLFDDVAVFATVLWVLVERQAIERGVDEARFAEGLLGDVWDSATDALLQEVIDFFPSGRRKIFQATKDKATVEAKLLEAKALKMIDSMSFDSALKSPESSA